MKTTDNIKVEYIMEIYNGENYICNFTTEYPKEMRKEIAQSRLLDKALTYTPTYKFFKKIYKDGVCSEWYRIDENAIT